VSGFDQTYTLPQGPDTARAARDPADEPATVEIRAGRARLSAETLRELWAFREVAYAFTVRMVKIKYRQAFLGVGWAALQPVLLAGVLALLLGRYAHAPSEGVPFLLFALAGLTAWTFFSTAVLTAAQGLVSEAPVLRKAYFPREIIPLAAVGAALVDFVPALLTLVVVAAAYGELPNLSWLILPLPIAVLVLSATVAGLGLSALNVQYRDVKHILPFLVQLGLVASAAFWPLTLLPSPWQTIYPIVNPVVGGLDTMRTIIAQGEWPDFEVLAGALAWTTVLALASYQLFKRMERDFADQL
jgi:lipopolysaccharide transport system permease protein